jgi:hypothetical protein
LSGDETKLKERKMNKFKVVIAGAALLLLFSLSLVGAQAAPTTPPGQVVTDPNAAPYIDNGMHSLPANGWTWYRFDYAGDQSDIVLDLVNGNNSGMGFKVFTQAQLNDWWEATPTGQGTPQMINCTDNLPATGGGCATNDLLWVSRGREGNSYYVLVANNNSSPMTYQLTVQGTGVTLTPPAMQ